MSVVGLARALSECMDEVVLGLADRLPDGLAVVATGGYGQGLLAPHSDIDLLLLSERRLTAADVRPVLMPLWDANLRVGHAVRTVKETVKAAAEDLRVMTAHLTMRHLWGSEELVHEATSRLDRVLSRRRSEFVAALVEEERERRLASPYLHLAPNLKWSRGGLRSLDLVTWLRRLGGSPAVDEAEVWDARERLFELRGALHLAAGRAHEVADPELRVAAARWLGIDQRAFVGRVVAQGDVVEAMVERAVPELRHAGQPAWSPPPIADDSVLRGAVEDAMGDGPTRAGRPGPPTATPAWTPSDREALLWLMTDARGRDGFLNLVREGQLERLLPEWEAIRLEPHVVPFHVHSVGQHSLRTADELPTCEGWLELSADERDVLRWAALFHDVGKGSGRDHSEEGARLVQRVGTRLRWSRDLTVAVQRLVRDHLVLVEVATRRDLGDPAVRAAGVARVGDRRHLRLLTILTEADSKATGTDTWTHWKATLVRQAARAIADAMDSPPRRPGALLEVLISLSGLPAETVMNHLANVSDDYRSRVEPSEMTRDLRLMQQGGAGALQAEAFEEAEGSVTVAIVAPDRRGLVAGITGIAALFDLNILAAQLFTRADGIACDRIVVEVHAEQDRVNVGRFLDALREGAGTPGDVGDRVRAKAHAYRHQVRAGVEPGVIVSGGGATWEIQLRAADRRGLLHDVTTVLAELGLDLLQVHVDTRAGVAYDTLRAKGSTEAEALTAAVLAVL